MNKKNIICLIITILLLLGSFYLYTIEKYSFLIVVVPLIIVFIYFSFKDVGIKKSPEEEYNSFLKDVMKTYDAVLIDVVDIPNVEGRSIVKVSNFESRFIIRELIEALCLCCWMINKCVFLF